jgi:dTDP-glucose pyrophosphorylase
MLQIVVPLAGEGKRFKEAGYDVYKAFLPVGRQRMIDAVISNVRPSQDHLFTFVSRYDLLLDSLPSGSFVLRLDEPTDGAVSTVLKVREHIDSDTPLLIVNSDQLIDFKIDDFLAKAKNYDGLILTFPATDPKWSYASVKNGEVVGVAEKVPISNHATCGVYYFGSGHDFLQAADQMIRKNIRTKGEFYLCPVYNEYIAMGKTVGIYEVEAKAMHGLGTPEDYEAYQSNLI